MNIFNPRFRLLLAGIILLAGGIVFEGKHRAATFHGHQITAPELTYAVPYDGAEFPATNKNFSDSVNLWFNPGREIHDDSLAYGGILLQSELGSAPMVYDWTEHPDAGEKIQPSPLTVADKAVHYSLFNLGNFSATLNLTPVLATPQAIIPTEIKPGLSGSFNF